MKNVTVLTILEHFRLLLRDERKEGGQGVSYHEVDITLSAGRTNLIKKYLSFYKRKRENSSGNFYRLEELIIEISTVKKGEISRHPIFPQKLTSAQDTRIPQYIHARLLSLV